MSNFATITEKDVEAAKSLLAKTIENSRAKPLVGLAAALDSALCGGSDQDRIHVIIAFDMLAHMAAKLESISKDVLCDAIEEAARVMLIMADINRTNKGRLSDSELKKLLEEVEDG